MDWVNVAHMLNNHLLLQHEPLAIKGVYRSRKISDK